MRYEEERAEEEFIARGMDLWYEARAEQYEARAEQYEASRRENRRRGDALICWIVLPFIPIGLVLFAIVMPWAALLMGSPVIIWGLWVGGKAVVRWARGRNRVRESGQEELDEWL